ncbi:MAG: hypothetical protein ACYDGR_10410, partial [Candidatus Dormibacteria bacterium]
NNDALSFLVITLTLYVVIRTLASGNASWSRCLAIGGLIGIALWVKISALVLLPAVVVAGWSLPRSLPIRIRFATVPCLFGIALAAPWWVLRNLPAYGSLLPVDLHWERIPGPFPIRLMTSLSFIDSTFWFGAGRTLEIGGPVALVIVGSFTVYGAARRVGRLWAQHDGLTSYQRKALVVLLVPLAISLLQSVYYGVLWSYGQGRYLFPGVAGLAAIVGVGVTVRGARRKVTSVALLVAIPLMWIVGAGMILAPAYRRVTVIQAVGYLTSLPAYQVGDLDTWVFHRVAPIRAEDGCRSYTSSHFSKNC